MNYRFDNNQYFISLDPGDEINSSFEGYPMPDLSCRPSIPTSDNISGTTTKRYYTNTIPEGKTISVAYNKGPYMVVDAKDFKTMGKKI